MANKDFNTLKENVLKDIEECWIGNVKYSGGDNKYVRFINDILNDTFKNLADSQPNAFDSNPLADQISINLSGILDEESNMTLKSASKEVRVNSVEKQLEFIVTRIF